MSETAKTAWINDKLFSDTPEGPVLMGSKCRACGKTQFPQNKVCDQCFSRNEMDLVPLSREGKLFTYTILEKTARSRAPYAFGFVDLPKEELRFFTVLTECEPFDQVLRIGMDLEVVFEPILTEKDGTVKMGYKFRPKK